MVSDAAYVPGRGDVVWLVFDPQADHAQTGRRPALVVSPAAYNDKTGLALFCPITSLAKGYPFEVSLPPALAVNGAVLSDQMKSLDWQARKAEFIGTIPEELLVTVLKRVGILLKV